MSNAHHIGSAVSVSMVGCTVNVPNCRDVDATLPENSIIDELNNMTTQLDNIVKIIEYERTTILEQMKKFKQEVDVSHRETRIMLLAGRQSAGQDVNVESMKKWNRDAQKEIDALKKLVKKQNDEMKAYEQKCAELRRLIDVQQQNMLKIGSDYANIREQMTDIQIMFETKMMKVSPITDMMRVTQMKILDSKYMQNLVEIHVDQLTKQINSTWEQVHELEPKSHEMPECNSKKEDYGKKIAIMNQELFKLTEANEEYRRNLKMLKDEERYMEMNEMKKIMPRSKLDDNSVARSEIHEQIDNAAVALKSYDYNKDAYLVCKIPKSIAESEKMMDTPTYRIKSVVMSRKAVEKRLQPLFEHLSQDFNQINQIKIEEGQGEEAPADSNGECNQLEEITKNFTKENDA